MFSTKRVVYSKSSQHSSNIDFVRRRRYLRVGRHLAQDLVLDDRGGPRPEHSTAEELGVVQAPQQEGGALGGVLLRSSRILTVVEEVADQFPQQGHGVQARAGRVCLGETTEVSNFG